MRTMALDYGRKRVGVALSDPLKMTAQPHGVLDNNAGIVEVLNSLIAEREVDEVVLGIPTSMGGNVSEMTKEVMAFGERLKKSLPVPIHFYDERLTTAAAERLLIEGGARREKRKSVRDQIAAALILQSYLRSKEVRS